VVRTMTLSVPAYEPMKIIGPDQFVLPCPIGAVSVTQNTYIGSGGTGGGVHQNHYMFSWNNWLSVGKTLQFITDRDTVLVLQMRDTCSNDTAKKIIPVYVFKGPFLSASMDDTLHLCLGEPAVIGPMVSDGVRPYVYLWGDGATDSARAIIPTEALRTMKVSVTDFCNFQKRLETVVAATKPKADFRAANDSYDPNIVRFENESQRALTYTWIFSDGGTSDADHPEYRYESLDEAAVKLVAEDRYGCRDSIETELDIPLNLFIPNAFTPDGDRKNELWQPLGYGFKTLEYTIYDRWGQPVFSCALPDCRGWDGTLNGRDVPEGTYAYIITVMPVNGRKKEVTGSVTVMR